MSNVPTHGQGLDGVADCRLFRAQVGDMLTEAIMGVKCDSNCFGTSLDLGGSDLDGNASRRLEKILRQTNSLSGSFCGRKLKISNGNINMAELFVGLKRGSSITEIEFVRIDLHDTQYMSSLASFLVQHGRWIGVTGLTLVDCSIGTDSLKTLLNALLSYSALMDLELFHIDFSDVDWVEFDQALAGCRNLERLGLFGCRIGQAGCNALARLLRSQDSNLKCLNLIDNPIDDESAICLAGSLANNTKLNILWLHCHGFNSEIMERGWRAMLRLVYDTSSIDAVVRSNHTLHELSLSPLQNGDVINCLGVDDANLLNASLEKNRMVDKSLVARCKLTWARDTKLREANDIAEFIAWFMHSKKSAATPPLADVEVDTIKVDSVYRILRSRPELCMTS